MNDNEFTAILTIQSGELLQLIETNKTLSAQEAATLLYSSKLFAKLEQEDSKLWHLSAYALYDLLTEEITTGTITYPEEV